MYFMIWSFWKLSIKVNIVFNWVSFYIVMVYLGSLVVFFGCEGNVIKLFLDWVVRDLRYINLFMKDVLE